MHIYTPISMHLSIYIHIHILRSHLYVEQQRREPNSRATRVAQWDRAHALAQPGERNRLIAPKGGDRGYG